MVELLQAAGTMTELYTPEMALMLATGLDQLGRRDEAVQVLRGVAQPDIMRPDLFPEIARLFATFDQMELAASFFESSLSAFPRSLPIKLRLGYILLRLNRAERVLEILPEPTETDERKHPPEIHYLRSHALRELKRLDEAARALGRAEAAALAAKNTDFLGVRFHLYYAALCEDLGHTERALERARKALDLEPHSADAANFLGYVLADHNRDLAEAEKWILMAVRSEPENYAFIDSLAWVYYRQGRYGPALVEISKTLRLSGSDPDPVILDHAGDIYAANGLDLLAEQYWRRALSGGAAEKERVRILEKLRRVGGSDEFRLPDATGAPEASSRFGSGPAS
jgi:tetratricopeptide (TPR) repeat protein